MTNNAIGSMPGTIPEQMTASRMQLPPSSTLVWSSAGPGCVPVPAHHVRRKPRIPKIWLIFAVLGLLLLLVPSAVTFLINLSPGDHSDNGDGLYWLSGLLLVPCMIFGLLTVFFAFCVGIGEWVTWVWTARQQHVLSARMFIIPSLVMVVGYILVWLSIFALESLDI